ncbi:sulfite exporter TauE/SafE family protein [uncultured Umboniibacter sp.]|uniref:sulfite exporter TauE/SafE family protein n=1 Tax=uncultured Umboniibacter sp. TaxID=1798917 RepID=UPI002621C527|nr:sulfite exporter TauE/SafE family protein [uncultured Umboniibacter sp.]
MIEVLLALIVFGAFAVGAMTGFGSVVLALSVGALIIDLPSLVVILVPLTLLMNLPLAWRNRSHIDWSLLLKVILPFMLSGMAIGYWLPQIFPEDILTLVFASFILLLSGQALLQLKSLPVDAVVDSRNTSVQQTKRASLIGVSGVIHGMYASGGPLLVYAMSKAAKGKAAFRATLVTVWLSLNSVLTVAYLIDGRLLAQGYSIALLAPMVLAGAWVGNWMHHRVDEASFLQLVYGLLAVVAILLILQSF